MIDDIIFYKKNKDSLLHCINLFISHSPKLAVKEIENIVDAINFYFLQSRDLKKLSDNNKIRTQLALLSYSFKCLAFMIYPIMTNLAKEIMKIFDVSITDYANNNIVVSIIKNIDCSNLLRILNDYKMAILK